MSEQEVQRWSTIIVVITILRSIALDAEPLLWNTDAWMGGRSFCGVSQKQGRRLYQEDRVICMPELLLPGPGGCSIQVGLFGVFDGHNGAEASEFASTYLPHLLRHHTWSILWLESNQAQNDVCIASDLVGQNMKDLSLPCFDEKLQRPLIIADHNGYCEDKQFSAPSYRAILKEAISRSLADLDSAIIYSFEEQGQQSGSTAVVVLKVDSHLLVANIGDSQAFVCSSTTTSADSLETKACLFDDKSARTVWTKELTVAHHPDRVDERLRIESSGGFVSMWGGIARVNGQLAVSRALGDASFKKFGVIAEPEFFGWQEFTAENSFLIVTSDGIFERMHPHEVCSLLQTKRNEFINSSLFENELTRARLDFEALAETIVAAAYDSGSYDNLAVVVYPLTSSSSFTRTFRSTETLRSSHNLSKLLSNKPTSSQDASYCYELINKAPSGVVLPLEISTGLISSAAADNFLRSNSIIKSSVDIHNNYRQSTGSASLLEVYHEHLVCFLRPVLSDEDEVCLNPETFSTYLRLIEAVPVLETSSSEVNISEKIKRMRPTKFYPYTSIHRRYVLTENIGRGGFGEVWFAVMKNCSNAKTTVEALHTEMVHDVSAESQHLKSTLMHKLKESNATSMKTDPPQELFVLKRILAEKGNAVFLSGLREKHFGEIFLNALTVRNSRNSTSQRTKPSEETEDGLNHVARYIESFQGSNEEDFWLVFINEGYPLSSLLYTTDTTMEKDKGHVRVLQPSNWWKWLKSTKDGQREMRDLLHQLLLGVKACHDRNITHRDIKPENMMVRPRSTCLAQGKFIQPLEEFPCNLSIRIIDFGSAIDAYTLENLYGSSGPTRHEQTEEYTPPESFLGRKMWRSYAMEATRYDLWSIGVVMLELVLGTPHVFQIAARTRALLDKHLEGWGSSALNTAYMLRAMMEMCILYPGKSGHHRPAAMDNSNLASWVCTEENLMLQIKNRDPLGLGLDDVWALRLLCKLLQWHPEDRVTVDEALAHPYFHSPLQGTEDGKA